MDNCLSMDVEGFVESNLESFPVRDRQFDPGKENYEIEKNVDVFLELLAESHIRATFFIVGRIARDMPHVVKQLANMGHEVGCHNYEHRRIFGQEPRQFREGLLSAKRRLEDVTGTAVYGFRAPDFSITRSSIWALDILREAGFVYDSSIYPIRMHDVYGIDDANPDIHRMPNGLVEWPLATFSLLGTRFPFGGGGYLRLYPVSVTKHCIGAVNKKGSPCMLYIHPYEVGPIIPNIEGISAYRRFRHYHNCSEGWPRLKTVLQGFTFAPAIQILRQKGLLKHA
jgi:polysaccharide deacetylase family protein (PEP-CTERM system associated)